MRRLALLLTFAAGPLVLAQSLEVTGHVLDPQGKPVASAAVHLLVRSDDIAQTKSDSQGQFKFDGLIQGTYTLWSKHPRLPRWRTGHGRRNPRVRCAVPGAYRPKAKRRDHRQDFGAGCGLAEFRSAQPHFFYPR